MAGHSKWANIKHRKAAQDAKRGKMFTKLIRELTIAARQGGGVPADNPRLRTAIDKALGANMTRDTIDRAIARGAGNDDDVNVEELTYEGYAPGGIAVTSGGDVYFADSNNHVIRRIDARNNITTVAGENARGGAFGGDFGPATAAQLDTPSDVAFAPDGDLVLADTYNHRIRRVDRDTGVITTIAGSGKPAYDGDDKPATDAALHAPNAVAAAPNGDIYIADTLNYRIRMIDHATGLIHTIAGVGIPGGENGTVGDGG